MKDLKNYLISLGITILMVIGLTCILKSDYLVGWFTATTFYYTSDFLNKN